MYPLSLQRSNSPLGYLRYNVHQVHRCHNLPYSARHRVPDVVLAVRLKYVPVVVRAAGHARLRRFQAVGFSHVVPRRGFSYSSLYLLSSLLVELS